MQRSRSPWLGLGEASRLLGITPATLRRWADLGQVPTFTTPGGHRRFPRSVIEGLVPAARTRRPELRASPDRIAHAFRRARPKPPSWMAALGEAERSDFRSRGRQLVAVLVEYLDAPDRAVAGRLLDRAAQDAEAYGRAAAAQGLSLADSVEGFLRFRAPFVSELAAMARQRRLDTREATALLVDAEAAMDRLLVAVMSGHTGR
ncbi:MAG TPA: helix-turn-helix domain-containing protein [Candidatus Dormibacteraeota bacterium]